MKVKINKLDCRRCNHQWTPRKDDVRMCPKCKSINWDKPRKEHNMNTKNRASIKKMRSVFEDKINIYGDLKDSRSDHLSTAIRQTSEIACESYSMYGHAVGKHNEWVTT